MGASRDEHLAWCKQRATEYLDRGDARQAWGSFVADMMKHEETRGHDGMHIGTLLNMNGMLSTVDQVREFIGGFN